nr:female-specific lacrimal gland protein-like [Dasypus novemcinctus]
MYVLLLSLTLGLTCCSAQSFPEEVPLYEAGSEDGKWNTVYLVANNVKKISENGPLRIYIRNIERLENLDLIFTFYVRVNSTCQNFTVTAKQTEYAWYRMRYSGLTYIHVMDTNKYACILFLANVSEEGQVTSLLLAFARSHDLRPKDYERYKVRIKEMVVPVKNIIKVSGTDTCPQNIN